MGNEAHLRPWPKNLYEARFYFCVVCAARCRTRTRRSEKCRVQSDYVRRPCRVACSVCPAARAHVGQYAFDRAHGVWRGHARWRLVREPSLKPESPVLDMGGSHRCFVPFGRADSLCCVSHWRCSVERLLFLIVLVYSSIHHLQRLADAAHVGVHSN